ncbi:neuropeptide B-like isoform X2 [Onychostoma macrolepis]|nr:neuropeptide B-like isoform X2 [Onychostoma macrolepis]
MSAKSTSMSFLFVAILYGLYPIPGACEMADPLTDSWKQCVECDFSVCRPVDAWYKQAARLSYYSVGRASGLLSGIRRSEPELEPIDPLTDINALPEKHFPRNFLKNMPICIKDVFPELQSCEFLQDSSLFKCGANVIFSLDSRICLSS